MLEPPAVTFDGTLADRFRFEVRGDIYALPAEENNASLAGVCIFIVGLIARPSSIVRFASSIVTRGTAAMAERAVKATVVANKSFFILGLLYV